MRRRNATGKSRASADEAKTQNASLLLDNTPPLAAEPGETDDDGSWLLATVFVTGLHGENEPGETISDIITHFANEVWASTEGPRHATRVAEAELLLGKASNSHEIRAAYRVMKDTYVSELASTRRQAVLLGFALAITAVQGLAGRDAWCQAAMATLSLSPRSESDIQEYHEATLRAYEELFRLWQSS